MNSSSKLARATGAPLLIIVTAVTVVNAACYLPTYTACGPDLSDGCQDGDPLGISGLQPNSQSYNISGYVRNYYMNGKTDSGLPFYGWPASAFDGPKSFPGNFIECITASELQFYSGAGCTGDPLVRILNFSMGENVSDLYELGSGTCEAVGG